MDNTEYVPYTFDKTDRNIKPRELECPTCKYIIVSELSAAKCGVCHEKLITVIKRVKLD